MGRASAGRLFLAGWLAGWRHNPSLLLPLLQYERERHRALSRELMLRRKAWELEEVERTAVEAARR